MLLSTVLGREQVRARALAVCFGRGRAWERSGARRRLCARVFCDSVLPSQVTAAATSASAHWSTPVSCGAQLCEGTVHSHRMTELEAMPTDGAPLLASATDDRRRACSASLSDKRGLIASEERME